MEMVSKTILRTILQGLLFCLATIAYAQLPQGIRFEGLARDVDGNLLANQRISLRLSILSGSISGSAVYSETHQDTTSAAGMFDVLIGMGIQESGTFRAIDWGSGSYYLKVEMDPQGGNNYDYVGTSTFNAVPYALYAQKAGNGFNGDYNSLSEKPVGQNYGDMLYWNGTQWTVLPVGQNGQVMRTSNGIPAWSALYANPMPSKPIVTDINYNGAKFSSNVTDGGYPITERGFCWGTAPMPTTQQSKTLVGTGAGAFTASVTGLNTNQLYYVRAYAINSLGVGYSEQESFMPVASIPMVTTLEVSMTSSTAALGKFTYKSLNSVTESGFCYSTNPNPKITDTKILRNAYTGNPPEIYTCTLSPLSPGVVLYVRAYAINSYGVGYGKVMKIGAGYPIVTTSAVTNVGLTTATFSGNIGNCTYPVTATGFCFGENNYPQHSDNAVFLGAGVGDLITTVNLQKQAVYYVRTFAIINTDTVYGSVQIFANDHICGQSITVNHQVSRGVAPENRVISYKTVSNVPGEPNKCWLESDLGWDWYWRFNDKQGFAKSGDGLIPVVYWGSNSGTTDWQLSSDPCRLELGGLWRIPTKTEWENADSEGMWYFMENANQSPLKLYIGDYYDGYQFYSEGRYASSTMASSSQAYVLCISGEFVGVYTTSKDFGISVRCIK
jgi:hypothetical protein